MRILVIEFEFKNIERDLLQIQLDQQKIASESSKDNRKAIEYYKNELEKTRSRSNEFESALKTKEKEIITLKNTFSKTERDLKLKAKEVEILQNQVENLISSSSDDNSDDLKLTIK